MNPVAIKAEQVPADISKNLNWFCFALFLISLLIVGGKILAIPSLAKSNWPEIILLSTAIATTLISNSRQLPAQNIFLAAAIIGVVAGFAQAIGAITGIPFGPFVFTDAAGPKIFGVLPWSVPLLWAVIVLNSRGVARLILRPWRKSRIYGFRLIGATALLAVIFDFAFEPFATRVEDFWLWQPTKFGVRWHDTPPSNFLGWLVTVLVMLAFVTPALVNKTHRKFPPEFFSLATWILLTLLFFVGAIRHQLWSAAVFIALADAIILAFSIRGARW